MGIFVKSKQPPAWLKWPAAMLSGGLVGLMFAPFNATFLVWIAVIPLLYAIWSVDAKTAKRRAAKGFALGYLGGVIAFGIELFWLTEVSTLGAVLLPLYLAIFWGMFGAFAATLGNPRRSRAKPILLALYLGAVWGGLEWLRSWLFTGFGWNGLGIAFHDTRLIAQSADLLGVTGLSMLAVFFQSAWLYSAQSSANKTTAARTLGITAVILAVVIGYGFWRIQSEKKRVAVPLKALLVQLNIPQEASQRLWDGLKVNLSYEDETAKAMESLKPGDAPDWVLWPESALGGEIFRTSDGEWGEWEQNTSTILNVRRGYPPFTIIYGSNEIEAESTEGQLYRKNGGHVYNALAIRSPENDLQTFHKHHLVIFGETIPFIDSMPWLKKIYAEQAGAEWGGSFTPGDSFEPLTAQTSGGQEIGIIPSICFEDTVPRLNRRFVRSGPQVIVNVTNDGWFGESQAADQHFNNALFRAIELRRPMLRCANTGVSAALDSTGSLLQPLTGKRQVLTDATGSHFTSGGLLTKVMVPLNPATTLYATIGDWGIITVALAGFILALVSRQQGVTD
ncbi:apolipoprotein N-acyltransferase [Luteolibacter pohnpeiensis]|uniref:Apolipoprotein N-acyltransferase n=1 Tax=Luteolibacter pohnpeiensis TaxID=454153 RepID=A0A934VR19_9BACT|nr:apolipoprotein N-acyltransferase [Luteolibacter pohnpeiensis]MBK1882711.1 apolipoprotein N-acyltransferase [Luteolibacter pohnpeiensis]